MEIGGTVCRGGLIMDKKVQYQYILEECIETSDYTGSFKTDKEKIWLILAEFLNWSRTKELHRIRELPHEIGEWLRGLPSCCSVEFCDYNIVQIGKKWGFCKTKRQEGNFVKNWWDQCGLRIVELAKENGIRLSSVHPYIYGKTIQEQMSYDRDTQS